MKKSINNTKYEQLSQHNYIDTEKNRSTGILTGVSGYN